MDEGILIWLRSNNTIDANKIILKDNVQKFIDDIRILMMSMIALTNYRVL